MNEAVLAQQKIDAEKEAKGSGFDLNAFLGGMWSNLPSLVDSTSNLTNTILANQTAANGGTPPAVTVPVAGGTNTTTQPVAATNTNPAAYVPPKNGDTAPKSNTLLYVGIGFGVILLIVGTIL